MTTSMSSTVIKSPITAASSSSIICVPELAQQCSSEMQMNSHMSHGKTNDVMVIQLVFNVCIGLGQYYTDKTCPCGGWPRRDLSERLRLLRDRTSLVQWLKQS